MVKLDIGQTEHTVINCLWPLGGTVCAHMFKFLFCGVTEVSQQLIVDQGGISLLSLTAADAEDPQTLRMVAGAIANLCGNGKNNIQHGFVLLKAEWMSEYHVCFWQTNYKQGYGRMVE